ncbi:unnamed protein product [Effrenium voratum]|nr:unnamed protein product [Effrenium voratum]
MQSCCILQHAKCTVHRAATNLFLAPDKPVSECLPYDLKDQALFQGNVPQPQDWLRAWRASRTASSFASASAFFQTDDFAAGRSLRNMIMVMSWVVKEAQKDLLLQADSISLSVDDRKDYRILRYRCSAKPKALAAYTGLFEGPGPAGPQVPETLAEWALAAPAACEGVLGVYRTGGDVPENTLELHDDDKSEVMANSIQELVRRACQDPAGQVDEDALQHIQGHVRHFASDQCAAAQKCGKLLSRQASLAKLVWVSADPAHQVRISCKDPLHAVPDFEDQWQRLFAGRHALIPDIQNSEVWKSRLIAAQKQVLRSRGAQGGGLQKVLRTFSFGKQRFDSTSDPMLKYCCLLHAIAVLCAMQAADERGDAQIRRRAEAALQAMTAPQLMRCGLTCDYTSECLRLLRTHFDVEDSDVARLVPVFHDFQRRQRRLFCDGYILGDPAQDASEALVAKPVAQIVFEQIEEPEPIYYGNRVHFLSTKAAVQDIRNIMSQLSDIVHAMLERLKVDLLEDEVKCKKLCKLLGVSSSGVLSGLRAIVGVILPLLAAAKQQGLQVTNKAAWSWPLHSSWRAKYAPRLTLSADCELAISFYLSIKLNTSTLERNLGLLVAQLDAHSGPLSQTGETIAAVVQVAVNGPKSEEGLFQKPEAGSSVSAPTPFARRCAQLWLEHFGRRFRYTYRCGGGGKRKPHAAGTFAAVMASCGKACGKLSRAASASESAGSKALQIPSFVPGLELPLQPHRELSGTRWATSSSATGDALAKFRNHTKRKADRSFGKQFALNSLHLFLPTRD